MNPRVVKRLQIGGPGILGSRPYFHQYPTFYRTLGASGFYQSLSRSVKRKNP
jgi:hypothetical protein